ncbi:MAG TPA: hypothetical protein VIP07_13350 [Candidatus Limnocylindria bacterium]
MKEKLTAVLHAQDSGTLAKARRETVGAFLERWVADVPVRETTRIHCRRNVQLHIVPALGRIPLAKLTGMGSPLRSSEAADTGTLTSVQNVPPAWSRQGPKVFFFHGPIALVTSIARQQHRDRMRSYLLEFMVTHPAATACALRQQLRKSLPWAHELLVVGDEDVLKVHVRTGRPDLALVIGLDCGAVDDIVLKAEARSVLVA